MILRILDSPVWIVGTTLLLNNIHHENLFLECPCIDCKGFIQKVRELINLYHPNILFFMETKINF